MQTSNTTTVWDIGSSSSTPVSLCSVDEVAAGTDKGQVKSSEVAVEILLRLMSAIVGLMIALMAMSCSALTTLCGAA